LRAMAQRDPRAMAWLVHTGIDRFVNMHSEPKPRFGRHPRSDILPMGTARKAASFRAGDEYKAAHPLPDGAFGQRTPVSALQ
jgi:hypothetical protein